MTHALLSSDVHLHASPGSLPQCFISEGLHFLCCSKS